MGTPLPRHSTARTRTRLVALGLVIVALVIVALVVVGTTVTTVLDRADGSAGSADDRPPATAEVDAASRPPAEPRAPAPEPHGAALRPIAPSPEPVAGDPGDPADPGVAVAEPGQAVGSQTAAPVDEGVPAALAEGVTATVRTVTPVRAVAQGPGESAGPGAVVRLEVRNDSGAPVDLSTLTVTAAAVTPTDGGVPASPASGGVAAPLVGPLEPGRSRAGTYVFALPPGVMPGSLVVQAGLAGNPALVTVETG